MQILGEINVWQIYKKQTNKMQIRLLDRSNSLSILHCDFMEKFGLDIASVNVTEIENIDLYCKRHIKKVPEMFSDGI